MLSKKFLSTFGIFSLLLTGSHSAFAQDNYREIIQKVWDEAQNGDPRISGEELRSHVRKEINKRVGLPENFELETAYDSIPNVKAAFRRMADMSNQGLIGFLNNPTWQVKSGHAGMGPDDFGNLDPKYTVDSPSTTFHVIVRSLENRKFSKSELAQLDQAMNAIQENKTHPFAWDVRDDKSLKSILEAKRSELEKSSTLVANSPTTEPTSAKAAPIADSNDFDNLIAAKQMEIEKLKAQLERLKALEGEKKRIQDEINQLSGAAPATQPAAENSDAPASTQPVKVLR